MASGILIGADLEHLATRAATIGSNTMQRKIMAAGIASMPSHAAVTNGVVTSTRNEDAVSTSATLACPAMIRSRSDGGVERAHEGRDGKPDQQPSAPCSRRTRAAGYGASQEDATDRENRAADGQPPAEIDSCRSAPRSPSLLQVARARREALQQRDLEERIERGNARCHGVVCDGFRRKQRRPPQGCRPPPSWLANSVATTNLPE